MRPKENIFHWTSIACGQRTDSDCLASFIVWQAAEVLQNVKPANLINILDQPLSCGRNMALLWHMDNNRQLNAVGLRSTILRNINGRELTLVYRAEHLTKVLAKPAHRDVLDSLGYPVDAAVSDQIDHLMHRMAAEEFPHEIGFFLGYPTKDVLGFMGLNQLPLVTHGAWKIYGDTAPSLAILNRHATARQQLRDQLATGHAPQHLLQKKRPAHLRAA